MHLGLKLVYEKKVTEQKISMVVDPGNAERDAAKSHHVGDTNLSKTRKVETTNALYSMTMPPQ